MIRSTILSFLLLGICSGCNPDETTGGSSEPQVQTGEQLNISILIDLSDRIDSSKNDFNPPQYQRDTAAIHAIIEIFKDNLEAPEKATFTAKDKLKVFFHPCPSDPSIANITQNLQLDLEPMDVKQKKRAFLETDSVFSANLVNVYDLTFKNKKYEGADLWHFMKDDVKSKCVKDSSYRNILVILTDGYMYWPYDKRDEGNKHNYIGPRSAHLTTFRNQNGWEELFDKNGYGFITPRKDLNDLEVLVMGINPPRSHPEDYDILKKYWSSWLTEMGVQHYDILQTDQPVNTRSALKNFFRHSR